MRVRLLRRPSAREGAPFPSPAAPRTRGRSLTREPNFQTGHHTGICARQLDARLDAKHGARARFLASVRSKRADDFDSCLLLTASATLRSSGRLGLLASVYLPPLLAAALAAFISAFFASIFSSLFASFFARELLRVLLRARQHRRPTDGRTSGPTTSPTSARTTPKTPRNVPSATVSGSVAANASRTPPPTRASPPRRTPSRRSSPPVPSRRS